MESKIKKILKKKSRSVCHEVCGFILESKGEITFNECENVFFDKSKGFEIKGEDFVENSKHNMLAIFHSHPTGESLPSEEDKKNSEAIEIPYLIYAVEQDDFNLYEPKFFNINKSYIFFKKIIGIV